jgi:hypothetical protein
MYRKSELRRAGILGIFREFVRARTSLLSL